MDELKCDHCERFCSKVSLITCCFTVICDKCKTQIKHCQTCDKDLVEGSQSLVELTQDNFQVLAQLISGSGDSKRTTCARCESQPAEFNCSECRAYLCSECSETIHSMGVFRKHKVTRISCEHQIPLDVCPKHSKQYLFYREECV